jgi:prepilin-type N-terminal cleavage/methylation domain-containing protein
MTLMELLVAMMVGGVVMTAAYQILVASQRSSQRLAQRIDVQQNVRSAARYLSSALFELDASDGDIVALGPDAIRFRSMQWTGVLCDSPTASGLHVVLPMRRGLLFGARDPDSALDSILAFRAGDPATSTDDRWIVGGVENVADGACADGSGALVLTVKIPMEVGGADSALVGVDAGAPLRGFQLEDLWLLQHWDGRWWLTQRRGNRYGGWSAAQPIIGPLGSSGFRLTFFDVTGLQTVTPTDVASIDLAVVAASRQPARSGAGTLGYLHDSLSTRVALRNNRRF